MTMVVMRVLMITNCPTCGALEIQDDFPTANQGPTTNKYECGSEWYDDFEVYTCGHKYVPPKMKPIVTYSDSSYHDRMGGSFSQDEINDTGWH